MKLGVSLRVQLKGTDLVAGTAYLTLVEKLGYADKLLSLLRLDSYALEIECGDAEKTLADLRRLLGVRTIFYNRNKHNYLLECRWEGGTHSEGAPADGVHQRLAGEAIRRLNEWGAKELDGHGRGGRVILKDVPVFRSEVLVEDVEVTARTALARRLESELATAPVDVSEMGTRWYLALRAGTREEAETMTREIVVTEKRDRGLLLNPNYQGYKLLSLEPIDLSDK